MNILKQEDTSCATSLDACKFEVPDSIYDIEIKYVILWDADARKRRLQGQLVKEEQQDRR